MSPKLDPETLEERKAQILKAAITCFARKGYQQATMNDVAAEAGLSKGGVYWHFGSKQKLFVALLESVISDAESKLLQDTNSQASVRERLCSRLEAFTAFIQESQELISLQIDVWAQNKLDSQINQRAKCVYGGFRRSLTQLIEQGIVNGEFKWVDSTALASILVALYDGLMVQWMIDETAVDWDAVTGTLMNTLVAGLLTSEKN